MPPRKQHYLFAHRLFRNLMTGRATRFAAYRDAAQAGDTMPGLANMWASAAVQGGEPPIEGVPTMKAIEEGIVITMPRALGITEAHFIAVVGSDPIRYFLSENSSEGTSRLCEWAGDKHVNYIQIDASLDAFLSAVRAAITSGPQSSSAPR